MIECIDLGTGEYKTFKMSKKDYDMSDINQWKLMMCKTEPKPKKKKTDKGWEETGEMQDWITKFKIRA